MNKAIHAMLELDRKREFNCIEFGEERQPILAVDSYLSGAEYLRDLAVHGGRFSASDSFYPGVRMAVPREYSIALVRNLGSFIERFFGLEIRKIKKAASRFSIVTTRPEQLSLMQKIPHFDAPTQNSLAVIHYLCDSPDSGTAMYRHNRTGFEFIDRSRSAIYKQSIASRFQEPDSHPESYIYESTEDFTQIAAFQAKFNRLIMYRGSSLHSGIITPSYEFDPSPSSGRLTVASFIEFE